MLWYYCGPVGPYGCQPFTNLNRPTLFDPGGFCFLTGDRNTIY